MLPFSAMGFKNHRAVPANAARLEVLQGCARLLLIEIQREGYAAGLKVSVQVGVIALYQDLTIDNIAILDLVVLHQDLHCRGPQLIMTVHPDILSGCTYTEQFGHSKQAAAAECL